MGFRLVVSLLSLLELKNRIFCAYFINKSSGEKTISTHGVSQALLRTYNAMKNAFEHFFKNRILDSNMRISEISISTPKNLINSITTTKHNNLPAEWPTNFGRFENQILWKTAIFQKFNTLNVVLSGFNNVRPISTCITNINETYPVENSINFQIFISKIISKSEPKLFPNYFQTTTTHFQKIISKSSPKHPPNFPHFNNKLML